MRNLDNYEAAFKTEKEMQQFLQEMDDSSTWMIVPAKGIKTIEAQKIDATQYTDLSELEMYTDTVENTGLYQQLNKSAQPYPVRNTAMVSIYQRNRFGGSVFRDLTKAELTKSINTFAKYAKGNSLIRIMGGKISAELSDNYVVLPMSEVFIISRDSFQKNFEKSVFIGGYFDYMVTTAKWQVWDKGICDAYADVTGENAQNVSCIIKIITSDTAYSGANIFYQLVDGTRKVYLSKAIRMDHKTGASLDEFRENTLKVLTRFRAALADLSELRNIRIQHPTNCMAAVMKKAGISAKIIGDTVDFRNMVTSPGATNALDLYYDVCQCVDLAVANGLDNARLISDLEEKVASCITAKWEKYDISEAVTVNV